jgi:hypothetical protein
MFGVDVEDAQAGQMRAEVLEQNHGHGKIILVFGASQRCLPKLHVLRLPTSKHFIAWY